MAQMGTHARTLTVAALMCAGLLAGCTQTVTGTVAQTTEPGPPIPDATMVTCKEYSGLTEDAQLAIVGEASSAAAAAARYPSIICNI